MITVYALTDGVKWGAIGEVDGEATVKRKLNGIGSGNIRLDARGVGHFEALKELLAPKQRIVRVTDNQIIAGNVVDGSRRSGEWWGITGSLTYNPADETWTSDLYEWWACLAAQPLMTDYRRGDGFHDRLRFVSIDAVYAGLGYDPSYKSNWGMAGGNMVPYGQSPPYALSLEWGEQTLPKRWAAGMTRWDVLRNCAAIGGFDLYLHSARAHKSKGALIGWELHCPRLGYWSLSGKIVMDDLMLRPRQMTYEAHEANYVVGLGDGIRHVSEASGYSNVSWGKTIQQPTSIPHELGLQTQFALQKAVKNPRTVTADLDITAASHVDIGDSVLVKWPQYGLKRALFRVVGDTRSIGRDPKVTLEMEED